MHQYLITGGAGFIGSHFIDYLLLCDKQAMIVNLDNLSYAGTRPYPEANASAGNYHFIKGDISDQGTIRQVFEHYRPQTIINFAAESHVDRSLRDPGVFVRTNVVGTQVLLEAARCFQTELFVQISTDEVYGEAASGQEPFTEESPLKPSNPYSASKAAADLMVHAYQRTFKLPAVITRCTNNFGPRQYPEKLIPVVIANALAGKPIPVYGDGRQIRDWLFVKDHCRAIHAIISRGYSGQIYNIAGQHQFTNMEVIGAILVELQRQMMADDPRLEYISPQLIEHIEDRQGHDRCYAINAEKTTQRTGWKPQTTFAKGIEDTVSWYLQNQEWLRQFYSMR